jgi:hypothetical protein
MKAMIFNKMRPKKYASIGMSNTQRINPTVPMRAQTPATVPRIESITFSISISL